MNVFDCHVNRTPCGGKIEEILYKPGKFVNASLDKASEDNERNYYKIKDPHNNNIVLVQIAGLVARRIVCEASKDQDLKQGDKVGIIRFGSRADVYYENYESLVKVGQRAISGETLLKSLKKPNLSLILETTHYLLYLLDYGLLPLIIQLNQNHFFPWQHEPTFVPSSQWHQ